MEITKILFRNDNFKKLYVDKIRTAIKKVLIKELLTEDILKGDFFQAEKFSRIFYTINLYDKMIEGVIDKALEELEKSFATKVENEMTNIILKAVNKVNNENTREEVRKKLNSFSTKLLREEITNDQIDMFLNKLVEEEFILQITENLLADVGISIRIDNIINKLIKVRK